MKNLSKKNLNAILALLMAFNLTGCNWFGGDEIDDEVDAKDTSTNKDSQTGGNKDKEKTDVEDKNKDKDTKDKDEKRIHETGGSTSSYVPYYSTNSSANQSTTKPTKPVTVIKADFRTLRTLLAEYKGINVSGYTPKSVAAFNKALANAEKVLNNTSASQKTVDNEVKKLKQAKDALTLIANVTELSDVLSQAKKVNSDLYTPNSMKALNQAIQTAQKICDDKNSPQASVDQSVSSVKNAMEGLVKRADFTALSETIETAKGIEDADYTDASLSPMYASLKQAESVLSNLNASQKAVDEAIKDLQSKLDSLVEYHAPDKTGLTSLIAQAKGYKENEYSVSSFGQLERSIKSAQDALQIRKVTDAQIKKAEKDLQSAIDGLTVDTSALNNQLTKAKAMDENTYTPTSFNALKQAIKDTETFLADTHKQYEIDEQTKALSNAMNQLVKRADKKDLQKAIDDAKATYDGDYTEVTMNALKQAVSNAEVILNDLNATQDQVSNATKSVKDAIAKLKVVIHKEKLQEAIDKVKAIKEADYTPNSYSALKLAYDQAVIVNGDENATQEQVNKMVTVLENAYASLVERADISTLNQKISDAESIDPDQYTDASLVKFNEELTKAQALVTNLNATQNEVDAQLSALTSAMDSLVAYIAPNFDDINIAISNAESVIETDWSPASYQTMKAKLDAAKTTVAKKKVTQAEVDQAKDELLIAYQALTVDLSVLNTTLDEAKSYQEVNYTLDSFKVLTDAIAHTETFLSTPHTQSDINTEVSSLQSAINQLVLFHEADKTALNQKINEVKALKKNAYTPNSYAPLKEAITKAETVKNNYRATVEEINQVITELDVAKANLVKRADVTVLNQAITTAKSKYTEGYTTSSLDVLKQSVNEAESVANDANATQDEVDNKITEINSAISNLVKLGDKNALSDLIDELEALNESDYTPVSWASASLGTVIDDAKAIRDKAEATETEVNGALDALTQAKAKLVKKADIAELEAEITSAQAEASKAYTAQSLSTLNQAITNAESVVANQNATVQEVTNALTSIRNAMKALRVDVTPLVQEITTTKAVDTTGKKPSTITALENVIKEAETLKDDASITFEQMNTMIQKLQDAVTGLQDMTDVSALQAKLDEANALNIGDYTTDSYAKLETVIQEVTTALQDEDITSDQMNTLIQKLVDAMNDLIELPTVKGKIKELEKVIAEAEAVLNDTTLKVPEEFREDLERSVRTAKNVIEYAQGDDLTVETFQQSIDLVKEYMGIFMDNLYDFEGLMNDARALLAEFYALDPSEYGTHSYTMAKSGAEGLEICIDLYFDETNAYEKIKEAYDWLVEDMENLEPESVDHIVYVNEEAPGEVLALLNAERKAQGLGELTLDPTLCKATDIRATEAHEQKGDFGDWAHQRPDGSKWSTVLQEVGYGSYGVAGENAARAYSSGESLYRGWMESAGHRANMMNAKFTKVGISMIKVGNGTWVSYMILTN